MNEVFFSADPVIIGFSVSILTAGVLSVFTDRRYMRLLGLALVLSLIGARAATAMSEPGIAAATMTVAAILCFSSRHWIGAVIGILYVPRVLLMAGPYFGLIDQGMMWIASEPLLFIQIGLAYYGIFSGGGYRRFDWPGMFDFRRVFGGDNVANGIQAKVSDKRID